MRCAVPDRFDLWDPADGFHRSPDRAGGYTVKARLTSGPRPAREDRWCFRRAAVIGHHRLAVCLTAWRPGGPLPAGRAHPCHPVRLLPPVHAGSRRARVPRLPRRKARALAASAAARLPASRSPGAAPTRSIRWILLRRILLAHGIQLAYPRVDGVNALLDLFKAALAAHGSLSTFHHARCA